LKHVPEMLDGAEHLRDNWLHELYARRPKSNDTSCSTSSPTVRMRWSPSSAEPIALSQVRGFRRLDFPHEPVGCQTLLVEHADTPGYAYPAFVVRPSDRNVFELRSQAKLKTSDYEGYVFEDGNGRGINIGAGDAKALTFYCEVVPQRPRGLSAQELLELPLPARLCTAYFSCNGEAEEAWRPHVLLECASQGPNVMRLRLAATGFSQFDRTPVAQSALRQMTPRESAALSALNRPEPIEWREMEVSFFNSDIPHVFCLDPFFVNFNSTDLNEASPVVKPMPAGMEEASSETGAEVISSSSSSSSSFLTESQFLVGGDQDDRVAALFSKWSSLSADSMQAVGSFQGALQGGGKVIDLNAVSLGAVKQMPTGMEEALEAIGVRVISRIRAD